LEPASAAFLVLLESWFFPDVALSLGWQEPGLFELWKLEFSGADIIGSICQQCGN